MKQVILKPKATALRATILSQVTEYIKKFLTRQGCKARLKKTDMKSKKISMFLALAGLIGSVQAQNASTPAVQKPSTSVVKTTSPSASSSDAQSAQQSQERMKVTNEKIAAERAAWAAKAKAHAEAPRTASAANKAHPVNTSGIKKAGTPGATAPAKAAVTATEQKAATGTPATNAQLVAQQRRDADAKALEQKRQYAAKMEQNKAAVQEVKPTNLRSQRPAAKSANKVVSPAATVHPVNGSK